MKGLIYISRWKRHLFIYSLIVCSLQSYGQYIQSSVNRDSILVGEPVSLQVNVSPAHKATPFRFEAGDSLGDFFEVLELISKDSSDQDTMRYNLTITSFEPGNQFVPSFGAYFGKEKKVSMPIPIYVSLVDADTTKPFLDIKPIMEDPETLKDRINNVFFWAKKNWVLMVAFILFVGFVVWWLFYSRKNEETIEEIKPKIPAHITANKKLKNLEIKNLWQEGNFKQYSIELSQIIRNYLAERYSITTHEKTSSEILESLRSKSIDDQNQEKLRHLLRLADLVKFAKERPSSESNKAVMHDAYSFVEHTRKKEN